MDHLITMKRAIASVQVFAYHMAFDVNASTLRDMSGVVRINDRVAKVAVSELENKALHCVAGIDHGANGVGLVAYLLWHRIGYPYNKGIIECLHHNDRCRLGNGSEER